VLREWKSIKLKVDVKACGMKTDGPDAGGRDILLNADPPRFDMLNDQAD